MSCVAFVFARGGSKGIPRKNLQMLGGRPLIAYSIETALASGLFDRVIVSTDSEEIAEVAKQFGAETPFLRPAVLATDTVAEWLSWQHALHETQKRYGLPDIFVSLPATSPLRNTKDVKSCVERLQNNPNTDIVITVKNAERSPYFNMVKQSPQGYARLVIEPKRKVIRRQDAPAVFDVTTVAYAARAAFVLRADGIWDGNVGMVEIPPERALDIDTHFDFYIAECIQRRSPNGHVS